MCAYLRRNTHRKMSNHHTADDVWKRNIRHVLATGREISPRGMKTLEILNHTSRVDMHHPVITNKLRKMGYKFMAAEAHWILSGDNRLETIRKYATHIANFTDNGYVFQGAYGPKVTEQLRYVCGVLHNDPNSRQAVMNIWRESPLPSRDIPCTLNLQFLVRRDDSFGLRIHTIANMRSSDLWLGWVYDVFNFTMITTWVALRLREMADNLIHVDLGTLYLNAGSQHLYDINREAADQASLYGETWAHESLDLTTFDTPGSLMSHIEALRDQNWVKVGAKFLYELKDHIA